MPDIFVEGAGQENDRDSPPPESEFNPFAAPEQMESMPTFDTGPARDSALVKRVKKGTGNELVGSALIAMLFAYLMPFGFILDAVAAFLLLRVLLSRSKPSLPFRCLGIVLGIWVSLRLSLWLLIASGALRT